MVRVMSEARMRSIGRSGRRFAWLAAAATSFASAAAWAAPESGTAARGDGSPSPSTAAATSGPNVASGATWEARYAAARAHLLHAEYGVAETEFMDLARTAPTETDRVLAGEMARVAHAWMERTEGIAPRGTPAPTRAPQPLVRTGDELSILYASAFLYGAGTGAWFLLQTQPDSAVTATLPFAGITAAPVVALALVDGAKPLPRGLPQGISTGLYLGLGEGVWVSAYHNARARRIDADQGGNSRWQGDTVASVLEVTSTLGAVAGGSIALGVPTTAGRISFIGSTTTWSGLIAGFATSAILPTSERRSEDGWLAGGLGYNAGMAYGFLFASSISPSVTRVRLVDLSGIAGALVGTGFYLSLAHQDASPRLTLGVAAGGAAIGLGVGTLLTDSMKKEYPEGAKPTAVTTWTPSVTPVPGGATLGIQGAL